MHYERLNSGENAQIKTGPAVGIRASKAGRGQHLAHCGYGETSRGARRKLNCPLPRRVCRPKTRRSDECPLLCARASNFPRGLLRDKESAGTASRPRPCSLFERRQPSYLNAGCLLNKNVALERGTTSVANSRAVISARISDDRSEECASKCKRALTAAKLLQLLPANINREQCPSSIYFHLTVHANRAIGTRNPGNYATPLDLILRWSLTNAPFAKRDV